MDEKTFEALEEAHFEASDDLERATIDYIVEHKEQIREDADECETAQAFIKAMDRFSRTWSEIEPTYHAQHLARDKAAFDEIVSGFEDEPVETGLD
jgi:hypothetical protein